MPDGYPPSKTPPIIRDPDALVARGWAAAGTLNAVADRYAISITPAMQALIGTADDPIGRQFVPHPDEARTASHELADPIGDAAHSPVPGIVHRYADRALLTPLLACPVYCRFCFRREQVGPGGGVLTDAQLAGAYAWLRAHPAVREVILTGGDPLMLSARRLGALVRALAAIPHVITLRIHTRVPCVDPGRVDDALCGALEEVAAREDLSVWIVLHANHAREFSPNARTALRRLHRAGVALLGQSVLLRGVNDDADALEALFRAMVAARVKPYYLHQLDPAPGTARFHVPLEQGRALLAGLRGRVTGLAWPTYVLDIAGGHGKVPVGPGYLPGDGTVLDPAGRPHPLPPSEDAGPELAGWGGGS